MHTITIYTDGASKGNPGPGGWGAIVVNSRNAEELGGREAHTTNNRMEMKAALEALRFASKLPSAPITVHTDSSYLINGVTKWVKGWAARDWKTAEKKDVLNKDLWQELLALSGTFDEPIVWHYVSGHVGIAGNERADAIASSFALGEKVSLHSGAREKYAVDVHDASHDAAKQKSKSASRARSRGTAYSYVSSVGGIVMVHKTWRECEARVKGKAARFKKALSADEERCIVEEFSR